MADPIVCARCGRTITDYELVNVEPADYSMDDPYPGWAGDVVCVGGCDGPDEP